MTYCLLNKSDSKEPGHAPSPSPRTKEEAQSPRRQAVRNGQVIKEVAAVSHQRIHWPQGSGKLILSRLTGAFGRRRPYASATAVKSFEASGR